MSEISVILPVYNAEKYVVPAIQSMLNQTFTDFELIIIDDGSTDNSQNLIRAIKDNRIRLVVNESNQKLISTLNRGLELARSKYIARMDADDIAHPERLKRQYDFLESNPDVVLLGSNYTVFGSYSQQSDLLLSHEEIALGMCFSNAMPHACIMMRNSVISKHALRYSHEHLHMEDLCLWHEMMNYGKLANLPDVLHNYRVEGQNISIANLDTHASRYKKFYAGVLQRFFEEVSDELLNFHYAVSYYKIQDFTPKELNNYLCRLENALRPSFPGAILGKRLAEIRNGLMFKFADRSARDGFKFALLSKTSMIKLMRYIIATKWKSFAK